eukprot:2580308-Amphidinium_carterae.2
MGHMTKTGHNTNKRLNTRFVAKNYTQNVNPDEIYAATPVAATLMIHYFAWHRSRDTKSTYPTLPAL